VTRARARWVADQVHAKLTRAGCRASPGLTDASVRLMVKQWQREEPVRPEDVRRLGVVVKEARRLSKMLRPGGEVAELCDVLDKAEAELLLLSTAAALAEDNA
jgi:hypothetical protein